MPDASTAFKHHFFIDGGRETVTVAASQFQSCLSTARIIGAHLLVDTSSTRRETFSAEPDLFTELPKHIDPMTQQGPASDR